MLSRRKFLSFLGTAPVAVKLGILDAFDPHRVFFDMGRSSIWTPKEIAPTTLQMLNQITQEYLDRALADQLFAPSPLFWGMMRNNEGKIIDKVELV